MWQRRVYVSFGRILDSVTAFQWWKVLMEEEIEKMKHTNDSTTIQIHGDDSWTWAEGVPGHTGLHNTTGVRWAISKPAAALACPCEVAVAVPHTITSVFAATQSQIVTAILIPYRRCLKSLERHPVRNHLCRLQCFNVSCISSSRLPLCHSISQAFGCMIT